MEQELKDLRRKVDELEDQQNRLQLTVATFINQEETRRPYEMDKIAKIESNIAHINTSLSRVVWLVLVAVITGLVAAVTERFGVGGVIGG